MPFTPFHFGPALLFGLPLRRRLDLPTFIVANVVVDARATLVFFGLLDGSLHGPLHTYVGASVLAAVLAAGALVAARWRPALAAAASATPGDPRATALAAVTGTWLHVTLDAFLYADVAPLWPLAGNPLLGRAGFTAVYGFCVVAGVAGLALGGGLAARGRWV